MAEFAPIKTKTVKMKVNTTAAGNIAESGDTVASTKAVSIPGIKAEANLAQASAVFGVFYSTLAGGSYDSLSATQSYSGGVA